MGPDAVVCGCIGCGQDDGIEAHRLVSPAGEAVAVERVVAEDLTPVVGEEEGAEVGGHGKCRTGLRVEPGDELERGIAHPRPPGAIVD